jgi:tetratricopeptide (TPR) repeat protein
MKKESFVIIALFGIILPALSSPDDEADELFAEASQLVASAREAEKTTYSGALKFYEKAAESLDAITSEYPSSPAAKRVASGRGMLGTFTIAEFKQTVLPRARLRAKAEQDPIACALLLADFLEPAPDKAKALLRIADKYLAANQTSQAAEVLSNALAVGQAILDPPNKGRLLNEIAGKLAQAGQYEQALAAARAIEHKAWATRTMTDVAQLCAKAQQADKAAEMLSEALAEAEKTENPDWKASAIAMIAATYAQAKLYDRALQLCETVTRPAEKNAAFAGIAVAYSEQGQCDNALRIADKVSGVRERSETLIEIARNFVEAGRLDEALRAVERVQHPHARAMAFGGIAAKYIELGEKQKALDALPKALSAARNIRGEYEIEKDLLVGQVARVYAKAGQVEQALQIAETIEPMERVWSLLGIASACTEAGLNDRAAEVLSQPLEKARESLVPYLQTRVSSNAALAYARAGERSKAEELISRAVECSAGEDNLLHRAGAIDEIAEMAVAAGLKDNTEALSQPVQAARKIKEPWPRASALGGIAVHYSKAGLGEMAAAILSEAIEAARTVEPPDQKAGVLASLAGSCAEAGQFEQALQLVREVQDTRSKTDALIEIGGAYARAGQKLNDSMGKILHEIASDVVFPEAPQDAPALLAQASDLLKTAQEAQQTSYSDSLDLYRQALTTLQKATAELEKNVIPQTQSKSGAEENPLLCSLFVAERIEDAYSKDSALGPIAVHFAEVGQYDRAIAIAGKLRESYQKDGALAGIAAQFAKAGQPVEALRLVESISSPYQKTDVLADAACAYARLGQEQKSSEIVLQALGMAATIRELNDRGIVLWEMAENWRTPGNSTTLSMWPEE